MTRTPRFLAPWRGTEIDRKTHEAVVVTVAMPSSSTVSTCNKEEAQTAVVRIREIFWTILEMLQATGSITQTNSTNLTSRQKILTMRGTSKMTMKMRTMNNSYNLTKT